MKVKEEKWKSWLKTHHTKTKIIASSLITSWHIDAEIAETDFIFLGSQIPADSDHSHEIKRQMLLGRKAMTNLDSVLKNRGITLPTKVCLVKAMVFPVVMYGCESWTINKAECGRIDAFELWCWRRLLRVPWTARRSNQSILMEISLNIHWKDMLKLQYFGYLMQRTDSVEKKHEMVEWHHWPDEHEFKQTPGVGEGHGSLACSSPWGHRESETTERLNWTVRKSLHFPEQIQWVTLFLLSQFF